MCCRLGGMSSWKKGSGGWVAGRVEDLIGTWPGERGCRGGWGALGFFT